MPLDLPRVIGHRGAAGSAPENTVAAFTRAAAYGARWVELDVQLTADKQPVVFHDDRLDRTTDLKGLVGERTLAEIRKADAGSWFSPEFAGEAVPTLEEALAAIAGLGLMVNIEIKTDRTGGRLTAERALPAARQAWPAKSAPPLISSFGRPALEAARLILPDWPRGLLMPNLDADWRAAALALGASSLHLDQRRLSPVRARIIKAAGLDLLAYTVNTPARADRIWGWGVDAVFTDRPERLLPRLAALGTSAAPGGAWDL